jgi:pyruvate kinase
MSKHLLSGTELLCTLGPASMNEKIIHRLTELGVTLFRINLSHTSLEDLRDVIATVQSFTDVPICLDTEGAQIRTGSLPDDMQFLRENEFVRAVGTSRDTGAHEITFHPNHVVGDLELGDILSIDFNSVLVQVVEADDNACMLRVLTGGKIGKNKAVTLQRPIPLSPLTEKDRGAISIGREMGIRHFALSFANTSSDVDEIRRLSGDDSIIISKIECINGYNNLREIAGLSDAVLIDRGDLSREIPIEQIPPIQKKIIATAKGCGVKVYVATNLLETMIEAPAPTRAEVNDIYNTLSDGADGLVLAAETAIGVNPVACANMVVRLVREFRREDFPTETYTLGDTSLLVPPHGGTLVNQLASPAQREIVGDLPHLEVEKEDLVDAEQIALGTFSPLRGFMDAASLNSVLDNYKLPDGTIWPLPIVLRVPREKLEGLTAGSQVVLTGPDGVPHSILELSEIVEIDPSTVAERWFGTASRDHPGVEELYRRDGPAIAGKVSLITRTLTSNPRYDLSPAQLRLIFTHKGWSRVVGFHTRNVAHRAHEHIQLRALERTHADGLLISPVVGKRKAGDFLAEAVLDCYQALIDAGTYAEGRVLLSSFPTFPRYAGPREAVFTALCRKNMGCSHFIIGRDHTGVGDFYSPDASQILFAELGDIGIQPVLFDAVGYDPATAEYVEAGPDRDIEPISATRVRDLLGAGEPVPEWLLRPAAYEALRDRVVAGLPLVQD